MAKQLTPENIANMLMSQQVDSTLLPDTTAAGADDGQSLIWSAPDNDAHRNRSVMVATGARKEDGDRAERRSPTMTMRAMDEPRRDRDHTLELWSTRMSRVEHVAALVTAMLCVAISPAVAHAQKDLAACKPVMDAMVKMHSVPSHSFDTSAALSGKGTETNETITTRDAMYVRIDGRWTRSPITPQHMADQERENIRNAKTYTCKRLHDASVSGVSATVYAVHSESEYGVSDGRLWVARSTGLPVYLLIDLGTGDAGNKRRMAMHFDYAHVRAPADVQ